MPVLTGVSIKFDTHNDNKEASTIVHVFVKNLLNNSLTPQQNTDFISNWLAFQRYQGTGDVNDGDQNPYLAYGFFFGENVESGDPSSITLPLQLVSASNWQGHVDVWVELAFAELSRLPRAPSGPDRSEVCREPTLQALFSGR